MKRLLLAAILLNELRGIVVVYLVGRWRGWW